MRVTFLAPNYPPSVGGAQFLVQQIAEGLVERHGCSVRVLTTDTMLAPGGTDPGSIPVGVEHLHGVEVHRLPVARRAHDVVRHARRFSRISGSERFIDWSQPVASGPLGARLAMAAARSGSDADVLVGVSASFLAIQATRCAARRAGVAGVVLPLLHLTGRPPSPSSLAAIRAADVAVALTEHERDWMVGEGVAPDRALVIPAGCRPEGFPSVDAAAARRSLGVPDRPTVGYVGRMAHHKGIDTLAAAMRRVWRDEPDVNLLLAGNHTGWSGYDDLVSELSAEAGDRLVVRERFTDAEKSTLFSACDVVAFPSREESFGMVTVEAWCARRPVVAGDIGAVRSLIRDGIDGVLVEPDDVARWADDLLGLLRDPERCDRMGRAGRARSEAEFSWPRVVDRWSECLHRAAARPVARTSVRPV